MYNPTSTAQKSTSPDGASSGQSAGLQIGRAVRALLLGLAGLALYALYVWIIIKLVLYLSGL